VIWWILLGGFVLGVIVLVLAALPLVGRLSTLRRALRRLQLRAEEAQALQVNAEELQQRLEALETHLPARS